ncbi:putative hemolysin [Lachnospiraceae bacterium RM5]|nr:putative hemolysin [Lachnospiraceae bacterium RM5]
MDGTYPSIISGITAIFFIISIVVYIYSQAVQNLSDASLLEIKEKNEKLYYRIIKLINSPYRFIDTVQLVSIVASLLFGIYAGLQDMKTGIIFACAWIVIFMIFGILLPKKIGQVGAKKFTEYLTDLCYVLMILLIPVTFIIECVVKFILFIFGIKDKELKDNVTEEDILSVINEGHEQGVLHKSEAEMINNIFEFDDKEAKDIMTHRREIVALDGEMTLSEAAKEMLTMNKTRYPVYKDEFDNIIGIVNFRDVMVMYNKKESHDKKLYELKELLRKPIFTPETKKINLLFRIMQSEKNHLAIVVDEYGQTAGIIAMEDILEEIVGNIFDEYDDEDEDIIKREDGSYVVKGNTSLEDITEKLGIVFDEDCETISGYLTMKFERVLSRGERPEIVINNIKYKILGVRNRMISHVLITFLEKKGG